MPELVAAVASMYEKQKDNVLVFLECNLEELAELLNDCSVQAVANIHTMLDYLSAMETMKGHFGKKLL